VPKTNIEPETSDTKYSMISIKPSVYLTAYLCYLAQQLTGKLYILLLGFNFSPDSIPSEVSKASQTGLTYHRVVEALKFGFGIRSNLGDERYANVSEVCSQ